MMNRLRPLRALMLAGVLSVPGLAHADPLMWRLTGPEDQTLYAMGTLHVLRGSDTWDQSQALKAVDEAEEVFLELILNAETQQRLQTLVQREGLLEEETLWDILDEDVESRLRQTIAAYTAPTEQFARMQPWLAAVTLAQIGFQSMGALPQNGIDGWVTARAREDGDELLALEEPEDQIRPFSDLREQDQIFVLKETLDQMDRMEPMLTTMIEAWVEGEPGPLEDVLEEMRNLPGGMSERLLAQRNRDWVDILTAEVTEGETALVAGGTLHFLGPDNVIELLEAEGWRAERIDAGYRG